MDTSYERDMVRWRGLDALAGRVLSLACAGTCLVPACVWECGVCRTRGQDESANADEKTAMTAG